MLRGIQSRRGSLVQKRLTSSALPFIVRRYGSARSKLFQISEEVREAQARGQPVVALETTIYTHGFPYPENVALASHLESLVRTNGAIPAHIGVLNGVARVGMEAEELIELISTAGSQRTWKLSRRDLGFISGLALVGEKLHGGTTIAGTMILAQLAGIKIFATGGLGGVHRGGENSMDISADLTELGRTPVTVISSGCKSFLDIPRTLEYLETQGVGVGTFADGRAGRVDFPAFFSRDSGVLSPKVIQDEREAAAIVYAQSSLGIQSGLLFANPVPVAAALAREEIDEIIKHAVEEAEGQGITGAANTPYILKRIRELSGSRSVVANRALIEANVIRGTKVAVELAKFELADTGILERPVALSGNHRASESIASLPGAFPDPDSMQQVQDSGAISTTSEQMLFKNIEVLVAGSLAVDTLCDYTPLDPHGRHAPLMHTSNPAVMTQSIGGVGYNVALAAHKAGASVNLVSAVADDLAGEMLLSAVGSSGLGATHIRKIPAADARTAQYVAFNDKQKDLVMAMADMDILASPQIEAESFWQSVLSAQDPKWIVVDANWSPSALSNIFTAARFRSLPVAFEPVSMEKATRLFHRRVKAITAEDVFPNHLISLATPNAMELSAMYDAARDGFFFDSDRWWSVINSFGMSNTGSRDKLVAVTGMKLVDQGVPQQSIQLLPYVPNIVTKLGSEGCLLTSLLSSADPRLSDPTHNPFIVARTTLEGPGTAGGLYMRLFPPAEHVKSEDIVSVNGVGDTMLGVLLAGLVKGRRLEDVIPFAQRAAVLTLKSPLAVSPEIEKFKEITR